MKKTNEEKMQMVENYRETHSVTDKGMRFMDYLADLVEGMSPVFDAEFEQIISDAADQFPGVPRLDVIKALGKELCTIMELNN